jgi:hypothetical protein
VVVVVVVAPLTRARTNSHHASCAEGLITLCSNVIRDLIQIIWEKKEVQMLPTLNGVNSNWYADSGGTDHVTGMCIKYVGQSIIRTLHRNLILNNVLHVPKPKKILLLFIVSPLTIMLSLHSIIISFLLRNGSRGERCSKARLEEASIHFHLAHSVLLPSKFLAPISVPLLGCMHI